MRIVLAAAMLAASALPARAEVVHFYYVGIDSRATIPSGTYAGLPDPNNNRLTFLYGHQETTNPSSNHYHAKGTYSYTGANVGGATAVNPYNGAFGTGNAVRDAGVFNLLPGDGVFAGQFVSGLDPTDDSGNTLLRSVDALAGAPVNSPDWFQFNSGSGRWTKSLAGTNLQLKLISTTGGASVLDASGKVLMSQSGDTLNLGAGDSMAFTPIFSMSSLGTGSMVFTLTDLNGLYGDSGQFVYSLNATTAVPEPTSMLLVGVAAGFGGFASYRRRRKCATPA
jgi:hypothetical protein